MPAVVILDLKRSGLDGLGALEAIRSNPVTAYLPVVVLTASNLDSDRTRAYQLGANGYVRKPAELDELVKTMGAVAAFWLRTNILPAR
jgi:CheY-like chemotaxis protein